jgi:hypothetical protein
VFSSNVVVEFVAKPIAFDEMYEPIVSFKELNLGDQLGTTFFYSSKYTPLRNRETFTPLNYKGPVRNALKS